MDDIGDLDWMWFHTQSLRGAFTGSRLPGYHNLLRGVDEDQVSAFLPVNGSLGGFRSAAEGVPLPKRFLPKLVRAKLPRLAHGVHRPAESFLEKRRDVEEVAHRVHWTPDAEREHHRHLAHAVAERKLRFEPETLPQCLRVQHSGSDSAFKHCNRRVDKFVLQALDFRLRKPLQRAWIELVVMQQIGKSVGVGTHRIVEFRNQLEECTAVADVAVEPTRIGEGHLAFRPQRLRRKTAAPWSHPICSRIKCNLDPGLCRFRFLPQFLQRVPDQC